MSTDSESPSSSARNASAGQYADRPMQIPWCGWKQIGMRVFHNLSNHNVSLMSAGVGLFGLLAVFPALNVAVTLYALIATPADILSHLEFVEQLLPAEAYAIFKQQLTGLAAQSGAAMNLTLAASILFGFWSARKGAVALITACNIAYSEHESRPAWRLLLLSSTITLAGILGVVILALLAVVLPVVLAVLPLGDLLNALLSFLRWPLMALLFIIALQSVYRFAPNRKKARWRWVSWGATIATLLWITASILFSVYVQNFGNYNETYGAIGSVIILIMWFYLSAQVIILGAEIDAEMEHQTEVDSTTGPDRPMGERGAFMADTSGTRDA
jgi:membrane protein